MKKRISFWLSTFLVGAFFLNSSDSISAREPTNESSSTANLALSYEPAKNAPKIKNWTLTHPESGREIDGTLELTGRGESSSGWNSETFPVEPRKLYRFDVKVGNPAGEGSLSAPCGTSFAHNDFTQISRQETPKDDCSLIVFVPDRFDSTYLRCSQWESKQTFRFLNPTFVPVAPIYRGLKSLVGSTNEATNATVSPRLGNFLPLGTGESIKNGVYRFAAFRDAKNGNFDRPLLSTTSTFNSNRWTFGGDAEVVYRFELRPTSVREAEPFADDLKPISFKDAKINVNVGYYISGRLVVEIGSDGQNWSPIGTLESTGTIDAKADDFFQGGRTFETLYLRLRGEKKSESDSVSFQIHSINLESNVDSADFSGQGKTTFAEVDSSNAAENVAASPSPVQKPLFIAEDSALYYLVANETDQPISLENSCDVLGETTGENLTSRLAPAEFFGDPQTLTNRKLAARSACVGVQSVEAVVAEESTRIVYDFGVRYAIISETPPPYFVQNYTKRVAGLLGTSGTVDVSWVEQDYKVPRSPRAVQMLPEETVKMEAAKNDFESFQIILRPKEKLVGLTGSVGDLVNENGDVIQAAETELRYAYYHFVENPTDATCSIGYYPDALVPLEKGSDGLGASLDVEPAKNLPVWLTVHIPAEAKPGIYRGILALNSADESFAVQIPFELTVWDFAIPQKNRLETAFGTSPGNMFRYHNCQTEEDKRAVLDLYYQNYSDHRISFYQIAPLDDYSVRWRPETNPPSCEIDFSRFDKEVERVFSKYNFTNFRLNVEAMGSGTYHSRTPAKILDFTEETPEYQAMFADYARKLESHLREKGWLDAAYCYWFDEPDPKDYEFVADGFARLKKYMPGLTRMLTEEPTAEFCKLLDEKDAPIDVWCPVSPNFSEKAADSRMKNGERFWWYVCCWPKAPYCTEFTDHPAHELRVWHWQTFERKIAGTLIWESTYWTSGAAFPNEPQNPYLDPMCYVSGYSTAPGTKLFWGNGDGRFVYPPLSAAVPGRNDGKPIFDKPVSGIRWEMIREGVEDYEMLTTLRELVDANQDRLTDDQKSRIDEIFDFDSISKSLTDFTDSPKPIYEKRRAVARMILELQR